MLEFSVAILATTCGSAHKEKGGGYVRNIVRLTTAFLMGIVITSGRPLYVQATELPYTIGQGFELITGKYGTDTRTDTIYAPFSIMTTPGEHLFLSLEIPFINQNNSYIVSGIALGSTSATSSAGTNKSKNGLGDIVFKAGYMLVLDNDILPQIRPTAFIKFPTADKNKLLGTGEFDGGFAVEFSRWFGKCYSSLEAGYTIQGKSSQFPLRNFVTYNAGIGYQINEEIYPAVFIYGATPPASGTGNLLETRLKLVYQIAKHTSIEGFVSKGITTFSPDYGTGLTVYYNF